MANRDEPRGDGGRSPYRDNDDMRDPAGASDRNDVRADSRNEARGDAREAVGNNARGTDRDAGPGDGDQYDDDLARDNRRGREGQGMSDLAGDTRSGMMAMPDGGSGREDRGDPNDGDAHAGWRSHARQGQAESPVERTHNEPPKHKEGHH